LAHQRSTISKRDLNWYLKNKFLPNLGKEWLLNQNDAVLRQSDLLIQGFYFDRSSYSRQFVPWYFVQILSIPRDHLVLNLGSRLKNGKGADLWLDWAPEDDNLVRNILDLYKQQTDPPIDKPLTFRRVIHYIEKAHNKVEHFYNFWTLGILYGLHDQLEGARKRFELAIKDLRNRAAEWEKKGKEPPDWIEANITSISKFLSNLRTVNEFHGYCEEQASQTATALKLPNPL